MVAGRLAIRARWARAMGSVMVVALAIAAVTSAAPALGATVSTPTRNLSPDCKWWELQGRNVFNLFSAYCAFYITDVGLDVGAASSEGTPATLRLGWTSGPTPAADMMGNTGGTYPTGTLSGSIVTITADWGDGTVDEWNLHNRTDPSGAFVSDPLSVANCRSSKVFTAGGGQLSCNVGVTDRASPFTHRYLTGGTYDVKVNLRLNLANYCDPNATACPAASAPPYFIDATVMRPDDGAQRQGTAKLQARVGETTPTVEFTSVPSAVGAVAAFDPPVEAMVGQAVTVGLRTSTLDPASYYNTYLDWGDGTFGRISSLQNPPSGQRDWPTTAASQQHQYAHPGVYDVSAQVRACTYDFAAQTCDERYSQGSFPVMTVTKSITVGPGIFPATISGAQAYGAVSPAFSVDAEPPAGVSVTGTVSCTGTTDGAAIGASLAGGSHTIDATTCDGLASSSADYEVRYVGGTYAVAPGIPVAVDATATFLDAATLAFAAHPGTANPDAAVAVGGHAVCTRVSGGAVLNQGLPAGSYAIDPTSCSGLTASDPTYAVTYTGGTFTVARGTYQVGVSGGWTFGGTPVLTHDPAAAFFGFTGTLGGCWVTVDGVSTAVSSSLVPGTWSIDPAKGCTGLTLVSDVAGWAESYDLAYRGSVTVLPATIAVTVTGNGTYGSAPHFAASLVTPPGVTVSGPLACARTTGDLAINALLDAGHYDIAGSSCSGLSASGPGYAFAYTGTLDVARATPTVTADSQTVTFDGRAHPLPAVVAGVAGQVPTGSIAVVYDPGGSTAPVHAGSYRGTLSFTSRDPNYTDATGTGQVDISPAEPTVHVTGGTVAFDGSPHPASVSVTGVGGSTVAGTTAVSYQPGGSDAPIEPGTYAVGAQFTSTDPDYLDGSGSASITIDRASTRLTVASSSNPSIVGAPVTFSATVRSAGGTPGGTVQFSVDGTDLGGPRSLSGGSAASPAVSSLAVGTHVVRAVYAGSTEFAGDAGTLSQSGTYAIRVLSDQNASNKSGSTIPIKVQLLDASGANLTSAALLPVLGSPAVAPSPAPGTQPTGPFTFVAKGDAGPFAQFNLKTTRYPARSYTLRFSVPGDPVVRGARFVIG